MLIGVLQWCLQWYILSSCGVFSCCLFILLLRGRLSMPSIAFARRVAKDFLLLSPPSPLLAAVLWPVALTVIIAAQQREGRVTEATAAGTAGTAGDAGDADGPVVFSTAERLPIPPGGVNRS